MSDKLLISAPPNHFICTGKSEPRVLAKCDACYTFPCQNGATCVSKPMLDYKCECAPGHHGQNCEHKIDACFGNPCDNGGTCKVLEHGRFSCHCPLGKYYSMANTLVERGGFIYQNISLQATKVNGARRMLTIVK